MAPARAEGLTKALWDAAFIVKPVETYENLSSVKL